MAGSGYLKRKHWFKRITSTGVTVPQGEKWRIISAMRNSGGVAATKLYVTELDGIVNFELARYMVDTTATQTYALWMPIPEGGVEVPPGHTLKSESSSFDVVYERLDA